MKIHVDLNWELKDIILYNQQTADPTNCKVKVKFSPCLIPVEYSRFLLCTVIVVYKVASNTQLANTEPFFLGETRD